MPGHRARHATGAGAIPRQPRGRAVSRIEIASVSKTYNNGVAAVKPVALDIAAGGFVVLSGPSDAGKSTLSRPLDGLAAPSAGEARIDGEALGRADLIAAETVDGWPRVERLRVSVREAHRARFAGRRRGWNR